MKESLFYVHNHGSILERLTLSYVSIESRQGAHLLLGEVLLGADVANRTRTFCWARSCTEQMLRTGRAPSDGRGLARSR
eukprot:213254-Prorocentrum_minimum.AAC.2